MIELNILLFFKLPIKHKLIVPRKVSTDRVEEAKEEQIEVGVEEQTTTAAGRQPDQPDQKVTKNIARIANAVQCHN